jgi:serine/threonine-protein kinase
LEAYDYYLRGNEYFYRGNTEENFTIADQMYQKAVELDPNFALAYAKLSQVQTAMYWFYYDRTEDRLAKAKESADNALKVKSNLPEAHLALGWYHYQGRLDYERALEEFAIVKQSQPNNSEAIHGSGAAQRRQGNWDQALRNFEKAAKLDPRSPYMAQDLGETYWLMRRYPDAERYLGRTMSLAPDWYVPYWYKVWLYLNWQGSTQKAQEVLHEASVDEIKLQALSVALDEFDGDYQAALDGLLSAPQEFVNDQFRYRPVSLAYAEIYGLMGKRRLEQAYYDSARIVLESKVKEHPEDPRYHSALGIAYAGVGRKNEATREGRKATEMLPVSREAWRGTVLLQDLARIYVMVGDYDSAVNQLEYLLSIPSELSVPLLRLDPKWSPLRDTARFQKLLKQGT